MTMPLSKIDNQITTLGDLARAMPEAELYELDALGDTHDDIRWQVGDKALKYIDVWNFPAMLVYVMVGQRTDYSAARVRQMCRVSRFYSGLHFTLDRFVLAYGILEHASQVDDPLACLEYARDHSLRRPGELKVLFPATKSDEDEPIPFTGKPLWSRPVYRIIDEIENMDRRGEAQTRFDEFLDYLFELI